MSGIYVAQIPLLSRLRIGRDNLFYLKRLQFLFIFGASISVNAGSFGAMIYTISRHDVTKECYTGAFSFI